MTSTNPLLEDAKLPPFSRIQPEQVEPAIESHISEQRQGIEQLLEQTAALSWENLIEPLDRLENRLGNAWSPVSHLNAVKDNPALRDAYNACLPKLAEFHTEIGQNERLYQAFKALADKDSDLNPIQRKVLADALRDFHLSGVDLPPEQKARFKAISQELSQLTSQFAQNLLDATQAWQKRFDSPEPLAGLPDSALEMAQQMAQERELEGWLLTLDYPNFFAVMTYADDRLLRREMYEAFVTRASDQGPHAGQWDNSDTMERILALRHESAQLLGFDNYAERSLATKAAPSTETVIDFLMDLAHRSLPQAHQELAELRDFARTVYGQEQLEAWDLNYYSEKLRQQRYQLSQEELRPYFPANRVIGGLFHLAESLFDIRIQAKSGIDTWHPDVTFYEVLDPDGQPRAAFYLDPYTRQHKRGGAWMDECRGRFFSPKIQQLPVAYLVCNFTPPIGDQPALLTHDEVQTLFHEFGHGLHHMLTRIDYPAASGISGVAWDAVELPSQFMENFCWEREVLDLIAAHHQTGEPLPKALFQRMLAAKNFQSAMQMLRQLEFSLFDFRLHRNYDPDRGGHIYEVLAEVRAEVAVVHPPAWNRFPHGFSHIFAGGYAAGYYSYKWAEVLSSDAYARFEEEGILNPDCGQRFLQCILEKGGSEDAMALFTTFRGRKPSIDALLHHSGITCVQD